MSDIDLRELERAADSGGNVERERLERAWLRSGLGWHGEALPCTAYARLCVPSRERGVYESGLAGQLVYVPGGEVECDRCDGGRRGYGMPGGSFGCIDCDRKGRRKVEPFYIGRFPITWGIYGEFLRETERDSGLFDENFVQRALAFAVDSAHHPVTHCTLEDARAFAAWSGTRLPTEAEWRWAALGAPVLRDVYQCPSCGRPAGVCAAYRGSGYGGGGLKGCDGKPATTHVARRYPWGNDPPTPERCVFNAQGTRPVVDCAACVDGTCYSALCHNGTCADGTPGLSKDPLVPARPLGASWCGAHDMAGNVWEWLDSNFAAGGSFRSQPAAIGTVVSNHWFYGAPPSDGRVASDELGFRVCISATCHPSSSTEGPPSPAS